MADEGYSMPLGSSPYRELPYPAGRNAELLVVEFEADEDAMDAEVPEPLSLVSGSRPIAWIFDAPQMSGAVYHEGAILLTVRHNGVTGYYVPYIWGDDDAAMLINREVFGWPQLISDHGVLHKSGNLVYGSIERRGRWLVKASVFLDRAADPAEIPSRQDWLQVRKIPNPVKGRKPFRHLIHAVIPGGSIHEAWKGRAALEFGHSAEFALDRLAPIKVHNGFYLRTSFDLPPPIEATDVG